MNKYLIQSGGQCVLAKSKDEVAVELEKILLAELDYALSILDGRHLGVTLSVPKYLITDLEVATNECSTTN